MKCLVSTLSAYFTFRIDAVCDRKSGSGSGRSGHFFLDPVPVRFRPNTDRIDRIWLSPGKNAFINLGVGFDIM